MYIYAISEFTMLCMFLLKKIDKTTDVGYTTLGWYLFSFVFFIFIIVYETFNSIMIQAQKKMFLLKLIFFVFEKKFHRL